MSIKKKVATKRGVKLMTQGFVANGTSWRGNPVKRDGKSVTCGHRHRSKDAAQKCVARMKRDRPGNCQDYRVFEIWWYRERIK